MTKSESVAALIARATKMTTGKISQAPQRARKGVIEYSFPPPPFRKRFAYGPVVVTFTVPFTVSVTTIGLFSSEFSPEHAANKRPPPSPGKRSTARQTTSRLATIAA
jgi:hypothetical protein